MSETHAPPVISGIRSKFKRRVWKDQIRNLLGGGFRGFVERGDEIEVITTRELTPAERQIIERIMEKAEDG